MPAAPPQRLTFGPAKYAAFNLLLCRWLRHHCQDAQYSYITLGGTELRDIENLHFIDEKLMSPATSFEVDPGKHFLAMERAEEMRRAGAQVTAVNDNIFSCNRASDNRHLFFFDFLGICGTIYADQFARLFQNEIVKEEDAFFLTSHLGHNPGWSKVFDTFSGEFSLLGAADSETRRTWYRRAHPSFTLFRALRHARLEDQLRLKCLGCVEYRDTSPMGLYGYVVTAGVTTFRDFIIQTPYFNLAREIH